MRREKRQSGEKLAGDSRWSEIDRHLDSGRAVFEQGAQLTTEEKKAILRARAKLLARQVEEENGAETSSIDVVEFLLASETYAIESAYVRGVYSLRDYTPLPCTPPFVLGIVNVRGQILSVIDIKKFFDLPEKGLTDLCKVIIVHTEEIELGILADVIHGARSIRLKDIQPPLPTLTSIRADYLRGVAKGPVVVLDVTKILSDERIMVDEKVGT